MSNYRVNAWNKRGEGQRLEQKAELDKLLGVRERSIKRIIEQTCEKAQIPYMRNRDIKLVKTKDGRLIPAPIGDSQRGKPDLTVVGLNGATIWIETKAHDGKLGIDQLRWKAALEKRGHEYYAPRTIEEAHRVSERILTVERKRL